MYLYKPLGLALVALISITYTVSAAPAPAAEDDADTPNVDSEEAISNAIPKDLDLDYDFASALDEIMDNHDAMDFFYSGLEVVNSHAQDKTIFELGEALQNLANAALHIVHYNDGGSGDKDESGDNDSSHYSKNIQITQ
ncbi:hypothetical protein H4219_006168 [Mycoemilia scoparia]|uniref:Uncharacterized protein n=1 Tax=Mycoemilia scoparia TaxID=417184 RepID=A0A9W8DJG7_9FUNG|nr:hypothetical protein H4219_006168 [Mycoemilia scoparia]